jgi:hypothetical protein
MSFDTAFTKVSELVELFRENEAHYLESKYQESEARKDFIDKFWIDCDGRQSLSQENYISNFPSRKDTTEALSWAMNRIKFKSSEGCEIFVAEVLVASVRQVASYNRSKTNRRHKIWYRCA